MIGVGIMYIMNPAPDRAFDDRYEPDRGRDILDIPGGTSCDVLFKSGLKVVPGIDRAAALFQLTFNPVIVGPISIGELEIILCHRMRAVRPRCIKAV